MNFKRTFLSLALGTLMFLPVMVKAQDFAYVDTEYILSQMPAYKSAQAQLDELSKQWQKEIDEKYAEIDRLYKEYQAEKVLLTKEMQTKREDEIIEKERAVKKFQNDKFGYDGELFKKRQELLEVAPIGGAGSRREASLIAQVSQELFGFRQHRPSGPGQ